MTNTDKERADFEAWIMGYGADVNSDIEGYYFNYATQRAWEAWLARAGREAERAEAVTDAWDENRLRKLAEERGWHIRESTSVPDIHSGGWRHPFSITCSSRELVDLLNRPTPTAPKPEPSPDVEPLRVKPLDLSSLLRHAFLTGRGLREGEELSEADQVAWLEYDPEALPPYQRIVATLSKPEGK